MSGTTTINSIAVKNMYFGRRITMIFQAILTVTDGTQLRLNGNLTAASGTTLILACDGAYWYEESRSVN